MIDINNESGVEVAEQNLVRLARFALDELRIHKDAELSLLLVDEETMADYHLRYLDLPGATDVMSFPMDELRTPRPGAEPQPGVLGDIVLCPSFIETQAEELNKVYEEELEYLLIHGLLHLLGHDHAEPEEKAVMFGLNDELIGKWRSR